MVAIHNYLLNEQIQMELPTTELISVYFLSCLTKVLQEIVQVN